MISQSLKRIYDNVRKQDGLVIVEACIVFPVMFIVLCFIIFIGNLYFEQAKVDDIVMRAAIKGAECVANPFLYKMLDDTVPENEKIPVHTSNLGLSPYRYILGGLNAGSISRLEDDISREVKTQIQGKSLLFFNTTKAVLTSHDGDKVATYKNFILFSSFVVQVNYEYRFPIRLLGERNPVVLKLSSRAEMPVSDSPEFIRNVDMAVDLLEGTAAGRAVKEIFDKINKFISKLG